MFPIQTIANLAVVVIFIIFWITAFVILYHLTRFGVGTMPKKLSALFLIGAVLIFSTSVLLFSKLDLTAITI